MLSKVFAVWLENGAIASFSADEAKSCNVRFVIGGTPRDFAFDNSYLTSIN